MAKHTHARYVVQEVRVLESCVNSLQWQSQFARVSWVRMLNGCVGWREWWDLLRCAGWVGWLGGQPYSQDESQHEKRETSRD